MVKEISKIISKKTVLGPKYSKIHKLSISTEYRGTAEANKNMTNCSQLDNTSIIPKMLEQRKEFTGYSLGRNFRESKITKYYIDNGQVALHYVNLMA